MKIGRAHETYKIEKERYEDNFDDVFARCRVDWCRHISFVQPIQKTKAMVSGIGYVK